MAQKTSGEIEKEFIDGLKKSTGKDLKTWLSEIKTSKIEKRNDIVKWLKTDHGFGHMNAGLLAGIFFNGGRPVYGSTEELLENQLAKAPDTRPLYEAFVKFALKNFPNASILPKKTYVSLLEKREFAGINIRKGELRVGLDLGDRPFDDTVSKAKLTGPMPRISHMLVFTDKAQFDENVVDLLRQSYERSN